MKEHVRAAIAGRPGYKHWIAEVYCSTVARWSARPRDWNRSTWLLFEETLSLDAADDDDELARMSSVNIQPAPSDHV